MIGLSSTTAAMLYLALTIAVLMGIWISHHYRSRHRKVVTESQNLRICEYCLSPYLGDISKAVTKCPACQCFNKK
ncbi:MAG: hypothetical protein H0X51_07325 [Parachlamydiaceae bacterium]|nr:hypothetical protein [Parachlamydiaceae bacterium]